MRKRYNIEYFLPQLTVGKASIKSASHFLMSMIGYDAPEKRRKKRGGDDYRERGQAFPQPDLMKPVHNWTLWEKGLAGAHRNLAL